MNVWFLWAVILFLQNYSFTYVSRARNSASLKRHLIAGVLSNGIWFLSMTVLLGQMLDNIRGKNGWYPALLTGLFYTVCTLLGSLAAHLVSLYTESGDGAVGANRKTKQVTIGEWKELTDAIRDLRQKEA